MLTGPGAAVWQSLADGTALLDRTCEDLPDAAFGAPSLLPGWSRAHVLTHLARNADAVARLAQWAVTGVVTPMYASPEIRDREIEDGATRAPDVIRQDVRASAAALDVAFAEMRGDAWQADLVGPRGNPLRARDVPALRSREVWVHLVDLDCGIAFADLPGDLADVILAEVVRGRSGRDGLAPLTLRSTDRGTWHSLGGPAAGATSISGTTAELLAWFTGRSTGEELTGGPRPPLPPWA